MQVVSSETYDIKDSYFLEDFTTTTTEETTTSERPIALPRVDGPVYPNFKKFFYVAAFLVFSVTLIAFVDIVRKLRKDRIAKAQGRRTYEKILPKL